MFGNCCGKKKTKKKTETKDAETQSEYELLTIEENEIKKQENCILKEAIVDQPSSKTSEEKTEVKSVNSDKTDDETLPKTPDTLECTEENLQKAQILNFDQNLGNQNITNENSQNEIEEEHQIHEEIAEVHHQCSRDDEINDINEIKIKISNIPNHIDIDSIPNISFEEDEVFEEGVGPPIKLAKNMGKPLAKGQVHVALPKWFSEEDDQEQDGIREPPATPIGKDELALRRHRFFSDLLNAAQSATEHKVHFDPLGPSFAGGELPHSQDLEQLVSRLENVTSRLENVCQPVQELIKLSSCSTLQDFLDSPLAETAPEIHIEVEIKTEEEDLEESENCLNNHQQETKDKVDPTLKEAKLQSPIVAMSVYGYQNVMQGPLAQYLAVSQQIGGDIATHANMVKQAFDTQLQYIVLASESKQPSQADINNLIQPTAKCIQVIQDFRERNRVSPFFNHLSAISESIPALGWVAVSPTPAPYVKEMNDAGQFYTNRVLKEWREKDKKHVDWVKAWIQTLAELQAFVKQHHTTGLVWSGKATATGVGAPPPPPGPPPPPAMMDLSAENIDLNNDRSALFEQINQGADITKSLKKVTADMQTHKNPTLRTGPAPFKTPAGSGPVRPTAPVDKPPVFNREGKKWIIEYQKGNHNLLVDGAEMNNVVYLFKCTDSTVTVKGKINSITLDSCKKTSVVFDSLVSVVEFINCQSVQMQVLNKVPTISIDKTDGCQMYLSNQSLDVEIVSSKSSEMNVLVPKPNGDYVEYPIPEQYKTTVVPGGLSTTIVENKG